MKKLHFSKNRVFVIAEIANSHEGDIRLAKKITEKAALAGADAVKFQKFTAEELLERKHEKYDLFKKLEFSEKEWKELIQFAKSKRIKIFVDVFGVESAKKISKLNINGFKIHSSDLNNIFLLKFLSSQKKPVLLSSGGALPNEINESIKILQAIPKEIVIMHGFQAYPTSLQDLNLLDLSKIKRKYGYPVGLMDHVAGNSKMALIVPLIGIALGAKIIEKHITLNRDEKKLDYQSSLNPDEFKELISSIRLTEKSLSTRNSNFSPKELTYRLKHKKNTISTKFLKKGSVFHENMFEFKRTRTKKESVSYFDFIGMKSSKNIKKGTILTKSLIDKKSHKIVAVIACRVDSERLFAKPFQRIGKYTILDFLLNQIRRSTMIKDIVLAISEKPGNEIFVNYAKEHELKFVEGNDVDVLGRLIDGAKYVNSDIILRVTSENPFIFWEGIDNLIRKHVSGKHDLSTYTNLPLGSSMELINRKALEYSHKHGSKKHRSELCTLFINENPDKFNILKCLPEKILRRPEIRLTVDTPQDLWIAKLIHNSIGIKNKPIPLRKIINFLDHNSQIKKINANIPIQYKKYD